MTQQNIDVKKQETPIHEPVRHLIFLFDGTWVSSSNKSPLDRLSNIYQLGFYFNTHNDKQESQIVFYQHGIGSMPSGITWLQEKIKKTKDGIFAAELPREVEKAYVNLCINYKASKNDDERDCLYFFGFSRGAVIARLVVGLIGKYGILKPSKIHNYQKIWNDLIEKESITNLSAFKKNNCYQDKNINIKFLGLFDSVYGAYKGKDDEALKKIFFTDRKVGGHVNFTAHILAINERRKFFRPAIFEGKGIINQTLEQIWMPGVHSDIGGGYSADFLSKVSLRTMLEKVERNTSLKINQTKIESLEASMKTSLNNDDFVINNELDSLLWKCMSKYNRNIHLNDTSQHKYAYLHQIIQILEGRSFRNDQNNEESELYSIPESSLGYLNLDFINIFNS